MYGNLKVVMVWLGKGGATKTTMAVHLAVRAAQGSLGKKIKRVLFVDVDGQQNGSRSMMNMEQTGGGAYLAPLHPEFGQLDVEDWHGRSTSTDLYYGNVFVPYPSESIVGLDILPSDGQYFEDIETIGENPVQTISENLFSVFASDEFQKDYDLVVFDCPPGRIGVAKPLFRVATHILMPFQLDDYGLDSVAATLRHVVEENESRDEPIEILSIVPTKVGRTAAEKAYSDLARSSDIPWSKYVPPVNVRDSKTIAVATRPVADKSKFKAKGNAEKDLKALMDHFKKVLNKRAK